MAYKPTYGKDKDGNSYKVNQDGSKTHMNASNSQYFPSDYGGGAGWSTSGNSSKPSSSKPSSSNTTVSTSKPSTSSSTGTGGYQNNTVAGTGGMTHAQYQAEVKRKQQAGQKLTNPTLNKEYNAIGKKLYGTSDSNKTMYGNNTSTHIMKQAGDKSWNGGFEHGKDNTGTYQIKNGQKVYMNDTNKQYFANNYGGTGDFNYNESTKNTSRNKEQMQAWMRQQGGYTEEQIANAVGNETMRTDSKYSIYGDVGTNSAEKQALIQAERDKFLAMSPEQLAEYKNNSTSALEKNFISTLDGTMKGDSNYDFAPIAIAPAEMQQNLENLVYEVMRQNGGIENYAGISTLLTDELLNNAGLGGLVDINQVNNPSLIEQQLAQYDKENGTESEMKIDGKTIMDALVQGGALKEGYTYNPETGEIGVAEGYTQVGNMLMDTGEATRWYGNQQGQAQERARQEQVDNQMYEEPLEWRAKHNPESMTEEMKADLQMERDVKSQLEQLTLELQYLENMGGGSGVALNVGGGSGNGAMGSMGNNKGNNSISGAYGNGGDSTFKGIVGGGRNAQYGTAYGQQGTNNAMLQAIYKAIGGGK